MLKLAASEKVPSREPLAGGRGEAFETRCDPTPPSPTSPSGESEPFELPGRLDFSEPIPILRDDASVPAAHPVSTRARRVGDGVK